MIRWMAMELPSDHPKCYEYTTTKPTYLSYSPHISISLDSMVARASVLTKASSTHKWSHQPSRVSLGTISARNNFRSTISALIKQTRLYNGDIFLNNGRQRTAPSLLSSSLNSTSTAYGFSIPSILLNHVSYNVTLGHSHEIAFLQQPHP